MLTLPLEPTVTPSTAPAGSVPPQAEHALPVARHRWPWALRPGPAPRGGVDVPRSPALCLGDKNEVLLTARSRLGTAKLSPSEADGAEGEAEPCFWGRRPEAVLAVAPSGVGFALPPPSAFTCPGLGPRQTPEPACHWDRPQARGRAGLARGGTGSCQELLSSLWGRVLQDSVDVAGWSGRGCQGLDPGLQRSSWVRETRFRKLTRLPRGLPSPHSQDGSVPSSPHPAGSGPAPRPAHDRLVQGTGMGHSPRLASPNPLPRTLKFPGAHIWKGFSRSE